MSEKEKVILESKRGPVEIVGADVSGHLSINWSAKNCGFGQLYLSVDPESGRLMVDNECMSREFVSAVLRKAVLEAVFTDDEALVKSVETVSLEVANECMGFDPHCLLFPFYTEKVEGGDGTEVEMRWHIAGDRVLRVRFEGEKLVEGRFSVEELCAGADGRLLDVVLLMCQEESLARGFLGAEVWSWEVVGMARGRTAAEDGSEAAPESV